MGEPAFLVDRKGFANATASPRRFRIGVDVGGTFTDLVLTAADRLEVFKVPTTPSDPGEGVLNALAQAAHARNLPVSGLLQDCELFVHGTTIATNILLERKGATVGAILTEGFRDSLEIRRGRRLDPWKHRTPYTPVLAPRHLRHTIPGRIDRTGAEETPIAEEALARIARQLSSDGVRSVAICLFNSFLNAEHEQRARRVVSEAAPDLEVTLSSEVAPIMGEYERTSTAVLNAYVAPRTVSYLKNLDSKLSALGLQHRMLLIQNNGGAVSVDQVAERSATLLLSGPAAGIGALNYYRVGAGSDNLISMEIGGTSCDVILLADGKGAFTDELEIDGYHASLPSVDVHTIGAGGGTIAGIDAAGLLFVGPQGAGARPGPACYGLGSAEPTVTDAQVVLGRLRPATYAGGAITIQPELAGKAITERIAEPLGISRDAAAAGIIRLMEQKLLHALQRISIERGHDPRKFTLVPGGGAGALHATSVARLLGCRYVYVPRIAGAFCALGMLNADVRHDHLRVFFADLERTGEDSVSAHFKQLETSALSVLANEGFGESARFVHAVDLRYVGQQSDIRIEIERPFDARRIRDQFEIEHQRLFGHIQPDGRIEITKLRVAGIGALPPCPRPADEPVPASPPLGQHHRVWIDEAQGWVDIPVYRGSDLLPGMRLTGPALIDEQTTTILIGRGDDLAVDSGGNFRVELAPEGLEPSAEDRRDLNS